MLGIKMEYAVLPINLLVCFSLFLGPARHATIKISIILKKKPPYFLISKAERLQKENTYHSSIADTLPLILSKGTCKWMPTFERQVKL